MSIFNKREKIPAQDMTQAPPEQGARRFFFLLKNHFWKIVALNALFLLFSLPLITMPAALCGMNRVCVKLVREGNCFLWYEFWKEFKAELWKSLPFGILYGAELFLGYYCLSLCISNGGMAGLLFGALGTILLLVATVGGGYVFVMLAMVSLSNRDILKNALALSGLEIKKTLGIVGLALLFAAFLLLLYPTSLIALPVFFFAPHALAVTNIVNEAVQKHIVDPYEAAHSGE